VPSLKPNCNFSFLLVSGALFFLCSKIYAVDFKLITWGSHLGVEYLDGGDTTPGTIQSLFGLDAAGTNKASLVNGGADTSVDFIGDLIELGFFDTDGVDDDSYTPNTDTSNPFKGIWTPITSKTTIGRDLGTDGADLVGAGEFYFKTKFQTNPLLNYSKINNFDPDDYPTRTFDFTDNLGDATDPNDLTARINALEGETSALLGIRFYDIDTSDASAGGGGTTKATDGTTRYNTIMHTGTGTDWIWSSGYISLHNSAGTAIDPDLVFEFENSSANAASKIGTGDNAIVSDDFTATVTYFEDNSNINVGDAVNLGIGSSVFSGLAGAGRIYGGNDANVVTLHSASGNTGTDAYDFSGDFYNAVSPSTASTDLTIVKSGTGDQILSGNLNLADATNNASVSGGLNITAGKLILKPASGKTQTVEYVTGTGTLVLDNSGVNDGTIVTLGFANQTSSIFSGAVVLDGTGGTSEIWVSSGTSDSDYDNEQTISGVISQSGGTDKKLVKEGFGRLVLSGNNSFEGGLDIDGGTVKLGHANGAGTGAGDITINTGKLEVATGVTVTKTINGSATGKSMIGGDGTISSVTVGSDTSEIDVISPGEGHSSSTSSAGSTQQVARNTSLADAIGSMTITTLNLNAGGVYDWEIGDFSGSTAGSDWDLLNVGTLNWDTSNSLTINILPLASDGSAGETAGGMWVNKTGTSGFKFLDVGAWGTGTEPSVGTVTSGFNINSSAWLYHKNDPYGDWSVYYDGSAFYLQYSAVPEPSTYMMVTGLLMVPGMSYIRRIRRKKDSVKEETSL
jgi:autotransporter-associated beta strand protein